MKIVQLIYSLSSGGAEKFVVNLCNELVDSGHEVYVVQIRPESDSNSFNKSFLRKDVKYLNLGIREGFSLLKVWKIARTVYKLHPDIIHCHLNVIPYIFPIALFSKKTKVVHTLHNVAQHASGTKVQTHVNKWMYRTGRITPVTISEECRKSYIDFYKLTSPHRVDNGTAAISPSDNFIVVSEEIRNLKTTSDTKVFLHAARCSSQKNQELLINSFNNLVNRGKDAILLVLGSDYESDRGIKLQKIACERIHFLGLKSNVGDYLLNSDFFCLSSSFEGLPISLLEALSAGVTPICTPVGGIPDVVSKGKTGYLSNGLDEQSYLEALICGIDNQINRETLKNYFKQNFSIEKTAREYLEIYSK